MSYRSTPLQNGYSPAELLMSRKLRTNVPISKVQRKPVVPDMFTVREREEDLKSRQKKGFDNRHKTKELSALSYGEVVWLPSQETEAIVEEQIAPRSYELVTPSGTTTRRNRRDIVQLNSNREHEVVNNPIQETDLQETRLLRKSERTPRPPLRYCRSWT